MWCSRQELGVEDWSVGSFFLRIVCRTLVDLCSCFFGKPVFRSQIDEAKVAEATQLSKETLINESLLGVVLDAPKRQALRHDSYVVNMEIVGPDPTNLSLVSTYMGWKHVNL